MGWRWKTQKMDGGGWRWMTQEKGERSRWMTKYRGGDIHELGALSGAGAVTIIYYKIWEETQNGEVSFWEKKMASCAWKYHVFAFFLDISGGGVDIFAQEKRMGVKHMTPIFLLFFLFFIYFLLLLFFGGEGVWGGVGV